MIVTKQYEYNHVVLYVSEGKFKTCITLDNEVQMRRLGDCLKDLYRTGGRRVSVGEELPPEHELMDLKLIESRLSTRTLNVCAANNIYTIGDVLMHSRTDIFKFKNFGRRSLNELIDFMESKGIEW